MKRPSTTAHQHLGAPHDHLVPPCRHQYTSASSAVSPSLYGQTPATLTPVTTAILARCDACQALILGERHKQPESPRLFLAAVQRLLEQGDRLLVGLEVDQAQQAALDAVLTGQQVPAGIAPYPIDSPFFRDMLQALSRLSQHYGAVLTVTALDDPSSPPDRDETMADTLGAQVAPGRFDRAIALVGNLHAIGNAIAHATGVRFHDLPLTPERIWRALRQAS